MLLRRVTSAVRFARFFLSISSTVNVISGANVLAIASVTAGSFRASMSSSVRGRGLGGILEVTATGVQEM